MDAIPEPPPAPVGSAWGLLPFVALTGATAWVGSRSTRLGLRNFRLLRKPRFQPPDWVFGPVWTALYALIAASGFRVWRQRRAPRAGALALWGAGLLANGSWTELFFGRRRRKAALADLGLLLGLTAAYAWKAHDADRPAAWMMAPYLGWLTFAGALNAAIVQKNG